MNAVARSGDLSIWCNDPQVVSALNRRPPPRAGCRQTRPVNWREWRAFVFWRETMQILDKNINPLEEADALRELLFFKLAADLVVGGVGEIGEAALRPRANSTAA